MEISNKTLAILLVAAISISLAGTIINMNKIGTLSRPTGLAISTGTANFTILSSASVRFATANLDLGAGYVNSSGLFYNCTLLSNATERINKTISGTYSCINFTNLPVAPLVIENNGNVGLNVTLNVSANASQWIGGGDVTSGPPSFRFIVANNESGSCVTNLNSSFATWTEVSPLNLMNESGTSARICNNLNFGDTTNTLQLGIKIVVPYTATGSDKRTTFLVTGT